MQVDTLSAQVSQLTDQVETVPKLQASLDKAIREREQTEQKLHVAVHENQQIQQQACNH